MSKRILAICNYPSASRSVHQVFVRVFLRELAAQGADLTVLALEPIWNMARSGASFRLAPRAERRDGLAIYRPRYLTYSTWTLPWLRPTPSLTVNAYVRTALRQARALGQRFDLCFAHFLYPHGQAAADVAATLGVPAVVSLGESSFDRYERMFDRAQIAGLLARFAAVITNSEPLKQRCVERYGVPAERIRVFPNGVDLQHFQPRDRAQARRECGLPPDRPIVISVGQLVERKGPLRVLKAIEQRPEIGAVFLGQGPQAPKGAQVLYQGAVPHEQVPAWLSAADLFVLPTLDEGCSNALIEAMACGLPIVSSDRPFNYGVLDPQMSELVDPQDVQAIGAAIRGLLDNPARRAAMANAARARAQSFQLAARAEHVLQLLDTL